MSEVFGNLNFDDDEEEEDSDSDWEEIISDSDSWLHISSQSRELLVAE
jgi:hypothetical protein